MSKKSSVCYSGTSKNDDAFEWRIESFSMYAHRGCRTSSSEFKSPSGSLWYLSLAIEEGIVDEKYVDFITVHLENRNCEKRQFVKVKLSICDSLGNPAESSTKEILFDIFNTSRKVFSIAKDYVMTEMLGLNKMLLLPNDVLTLRCEMTVTEEKPPEFEPEDSFENRYFQNNTSLLWLTKVLIVLRPFIFGGRDFISSAAPVIFSYWYQIMISFTAIFLIYVSSDAIIWTLSTVYLLLNCLHLCVLMLWDLKYIVLGACVLWKVHQFNTRKGKNKNIVSYQPKHGRPVYWNNQSGYYLVPEETIRYLYGLIKSKGNHGGQGRITPDGYFQKRPQLTYNNNYYQ